ncbi:MAG: hypothetical protein ACREFI_16145 [Stellaceae bacterium]
MEHGAAPTMAMTHIAIQEDLNGTVVDWLERASDDSTRRSPPTSKDIRTPQE